MVLETRFQSVFDVAEIFSPPTICRRDRARGLRGGWSLDSGAFRPVTGKTWDLSREMEQKKAWTLFYNTKPKLLIALPPALDQDWSSSKVDLAANMCMSRYKAGRKLVFDHPASILSWSLPCVKRLGDFSGIYSVDFDGMRLFTNSWRIHGLVDKRTATTESWTFTIIMEEIHGQNEERLNLMPLADMCDSEEDKQVTESIVGIDDVSGEPIDQSHSKSAAGGDARIQRTRSLSSCSTKNR